MFLSGVNFMKLYIIRHGQTEWNKSGRLQGQTDIALNENGRELAVKVGAALKDIPFAKVFSSPLARSKETAELVLKENSGNAGKRFREGQQWKSRNCAKNIEISDAAFMEEVLLTEEKIKEISFGEYEGFSIPSTALFTGDPKYAITDPDFHNFFDAPEKYRPPKGGEEIEKLLQRTGDFLRELAAEADVLEKQKDCEECILVSTHGAASRALLANIKHTELKDFWYPGVPKNCSVSIVETKNGIWQMVEQDIIYY